jgi:hypothetical protein
MDSVLRPCDEFSLARDAVVTLAMAQYPKKLLTQLQIQMERYL